MGKNVPGPNFDGTTRSDAFPKPIAAKTTPSGAEQPAQGISFLNHNQIHDYLASEIESNYVIILPECGTLDRNRGTILLFKTLPKDVQIRNLFFRNSISSNVQLEMMRIAALLLHMGHAMHNECVIAVDPNSHRVGRKNKIRAGDRIEIEAKTLPGNCIDVVISRGDSTEISSARFNVICN